MAVKMRLMRMGKTKSPYYRVVVIDGRAPRDGRYIDLIGRYDPREEPSTIEIDAEKAVEWLRKGAQPTEAVSKLLEASGALTHFRVKAGRIHTVGGTAVAPVAEEEPAETASGADEQPSDEAATEVPASDETEEAASDADAEADAGSEEE